MNRTAPLLVALTLAACQQEAPSPPAANDAAPALPPPAQPVTNPPAAAEPLPSDDWRDYARPEDAERLKQLDTAWEEARAAASKGGMEALEKLGAVADPKTPALKAPQPAPGDYRCRTIKIGGLGVIAYGWFRCRIELTPGGDLTFVKLTGSQRGEGKFYPSGESEPRTHRRDALAARPAATPRREHARYRGAEEVT